MRLVGARAAQRRRRVQALDERQQRRRRLGIGDDGTFDDGDGDGAISGDGGDDSDGGNDCIGSLHPC